MLNLLKEEIRKMGVSSYAYVYARVRARMSDILDERKIKAVLDAKNKEDFLSSLMDTAYRDRLTKVPSKEIRDMEKALKEELIDQYLMVIKSTKHEIREMFIEILRRLEVENIKSVIRSKVMAFPSGVSEREEPLFFPVVSFFRRKMDKLSEAENLEEMIKQLEEPYRSVLEEVLPEYEKSKRILVLENALDKEIFDALWNRIEKLKGEDKEIVRRIIGSEFDIANIMTLLRCKAEGVEEKEIQKYFLPYVYAFNFNATDIKASISAEDVVSAIRLLPPSDYKEALTQSIPVYEEEKSPIPFENSLRKQFSRIIKNALKGYPLNIGTVIGYLYFKEEEIKNLCAISVCKENNIPAEEIMKFIMI